MLRTNEVIVVTTDNGGPVIDCAGIGASNLPLRGVERDRGGWVQSKGISMYFSGFYIILFLGFIFF